MNIISGAGTAYPSRPPRLVLLNLYRSVLSTYSFRFGHCIVYLSISTSDYPSRISKSLLNINWSYTFREISSHREGTEMCKYLSLKYRCLDSGVRLVVFVATFNSISLISWRSVLLVEETGVPGEIHRHAASNWQTVSHNVVSGTARLEQDSNSHH